MTDKRKTYPPPFSLRLTFEERAMLETAAAGMPVGAYIREKLFGPDASHRKTRGKAPVKDHQALARVLGALGGSRLASNLNQLAKAAHMGALPVSAEMAETTRSTDSRTARCRYSAFSLFDQPTLISSWSERAKRG
jgi:hypothetical protein